jgi:hypothetical protein
MSTPSTPPKYLKLGILASIIGALMIITFIVVTVTDFPLDGAGILLILGLALLIGGITGGLWVGQR